MSSFRTQGISPAQSMDSSYLNHNVTTVIQEGFICADCHRQFTGVEDLLRHYESFHSNPSNSSGSSNTFKGFLGKAKKTLQTFNNNQPQAFTQAQSQFSQSQVDSVTPVSRTATYYDCLNESKQDVGSSRSHFDSFKSFRSTKIERYASESNRLIIRLHKLMSNGDDASSPRAEGEQEKRRAHEQSVVNWIDEKTVTRCPECAVPFSTLLLRRKHHCRLCGSVMCEECSRFITAEEGRSFTSRLRVGGSLTTDNVEIKTHRKRDSITSISSLTGPSLSSLIGQIKGTHSGAKEPTIRSCSYCYSLLQQAKHRFEQKEQTSPTSEVSSLTMSPNKSHNLMSLYTSLQSNIEEIRKLIPRLKTISESLYDGDSLYSLQQANELRAKVIKLTESIDLTSKRISALGVVRESLEASSSSHTSLLLLQSRIRQSSIVLIREILSDLPILPDDKELKEIREHRGGGNIKRKDDEFVEVLSGWSAAAPRSQGYCMNPFEDDADCDNGFGSNPFDDDGNVDPIQEQIKNVKFYIQQATAANKLDEVQILGKSLKDLYLEQERQRKKTSNPMQNPGLAPHKKK